MLVNKGSVRVDLVGGTIDLEPINVILKNVITLNVATSLKAEVKISKIDDKNLKIISSDYQKEYILPSHEMTDENIYYNHKFKEMSFILQILDLFKIRTGIQLELHSGAPAGSGLGGSSAMGVTLYKALCQWTDTPFNISEAVIRVKGTEARILNQGVPGYQDYYPALVGGILAIKGIPGKIEYEQLYTDELKNYLEKNMMLVYSGISRSSGINNWEVYKKFFDKDIATREGLQLIADISEKTYQAIKAKKYSEILTLINQEGVAREKLFKDIVPHEVKNIEQKLNNLNSQIGIKMCGAGGGGCFLITNCEKHMEEIKNIIQESKMRILDFKIERPL
jgi:D-glycero-alpha-D-manno-heptose-7-phosphate kinase